MIQTLILLFAFSLFHIGAGYTRPKLCPGGYEEGRIVERGRYWYQCQEAQLIPKGCINNGSKIQIQEAFDSNDHGYRFQCVLNSDGNLDIVYKSCLNNGREYNTGEEWDGDKYYYRCEKESTDYLRTTLAGCLDGQTRVKINERVTKGHFIYQCRQSADGTCSMCPVGCTKYGKEYAIGDQFDLGQFWFTCTRLGENGRGPVAIKGIGCLDDKKNRLKDGERYFKDDVIYECTVRETGATVNPVGCLQHDTSGSTIERRLDCYWVEGDGVYQYEMTCKQGNNTKTAIKEQSRCLYKPQQGTYTIEPGCYQIVDKTAVACKKEVSGNGLSIQVYQVDQIGQLTGQGLRFC